MLDETPLISTLLSNMIIKNTNVTRKIQEDTTSGGCYAMVYDGEGTVEFKDGGHYVGNL